jgi:integrase/recombinase XerC
MSVAHALPGAPGLALAPGVLHLEPQRAVFDGMVEGWATQMVSRGLRRETIDGRTGTVRRFAAFTNEYPWRWGPGDVEEYSALLRSEPAPLAWSTIRGYQNHLGLFLNFATDPRYKWADECEARFGTHPVQICHEWNTLAHRDEYEGRPGRRPLSQVELQRFFDYADDQVDSVAASGRKGALAAARDACLLKVVYGWGLRRTEALMVDVADWHRHPAADRFGERGALQVRWGKAKRGGSPRRRMVASLFDWAVEALEFYLDEVRPRFEVGDHPALWVTERRSRLSPRALDERFAAYREALGFGPEIDLHCLRHSYATHLAESGYPERYISEQLGHEAAATTAIYTSVSDDFKNQVLVRALAGAFDPGGSR